MATKTIEGVKTFLNDIINNANRLTSGNIAHNGNAIRLLAESTLSEIDEALTEQDRISRAEERERCINAAIEWLRKYVRPYYKFSIGTFRKAMEGGAEC